MEESIPVAKVTRLRRRPSVEAEDVKSPSTPSTPTKKRGSRLAAKSQLELIDENAQEKVPRRTTRKSIAKEIEPVEDKVLTPSRRSARIRSNTSIISDTTQGLDSPRARRVTRRNSQIGSDTETTLTPARQTRRTRKDSTSSIDKPIDNITNKINDIIVEEKDINVEEEVSKEKSLRKSPRLRGNNQSCEPKTIATSDETQNNKVTTSNDHKDNGEEKNIQSLMDNKPVLSLKDTVKSTETKSTTALLSQDNEKIDTSLLNVSNDEKENLSLSSSNLLKTMNKEPKKIREFFNKSAPNLIEPSKYNSKRHRTKSFTINSGDFDNEAYFLSDNEMVKKKVRNKMINSDMSKSSGDATIKFKNQKIYRQEKIKSDITRENKNINSSMSEEIKESNVKENATEHNKEDTLQSENITPTTALLLEQKPSDFQISVVLESDSNSSTDRKDTYQHLKNEDQCVPVVDTKANISCEPMDIGETIPGNISIHDSSENRGPSEIIINDHNKSGRKSNLTMVQDTTEKTYNSRQKIEHEDKDISEKSKINVTSDQMNDINKNDQENENTLNIVKNGKKSKRKSSVLLENEIDNTKDTNTSKRNSSDINILEELEASKENSTTTLDITNKSKRKSSNNTQLLEPEMFKKGGKRTSSFSTPSQDLIEITKDDDVPQTMSNSMMSPDNSINKKHNRSKNKSVSETSVTRADDSCKLLKGKASKSMDTITKDNDCDSKNTSVNYLTTSTPLQQKPLRKLGLPVDTSNIGLKNKENAENPKNEYRKDKSLKKSFDKTSDDDGDKPDPDVESFTGSNLIADEAEEASDDYESGDSRDDEEREYEKENEITEKGETLDSEEEYSEDTDYEKDSFVVSSDEEDNDLLSGSGDDLSMSDNELTMSKKSKNKYNDRKRKEQKKASKEMYDARHELDESEENIIKGKKNNRQRFDSSLVSTDDEEPIAPINKNKHLRIDSSYDISNTEYETNTSESKNKKKNKKSESSCNQSALNEKEIAICESNEAKSDPLLVDVKKESKTPQRDLDISTVHISKMQNIEEVQVDENISIIGQNETSDPLQATTVAENNDDSSLSENPEIMENYDSLLHNLSNVKSKKVKTMNISLNIDKQPKKNNKAPIFDELNLTQIESKKNNKINTTEPLKVPKTIDKVTQIISSDTESSSNSIDMRLIFPEDSNDSEANAGTFKATEKNSNCSQDIVALKKSHGTTNISVDKGNENDDSSILEVSKKRKNKNRKSSEPIESLSATEETENLFFIDTKGTHDDGNDNTNTSEINIKKKKRDKNITIDIPVQILHINNSFNKKPKLSLPTETNYYTEKADLSDEAPLEVSFTKKKKKTKHTSDDSKVEEVESANKVDEMSVNEQSQSPKKKKKSKDTLYIPENKNKQQNVEVDSANVVEEVSIGDQSERTKKKKRSKHALESQENNSEQQENVEGDKFVEDVPLDTTCKKKGFKDLLHVDNDVYNVDDISPISMEQKTKKKKSNRSFNESVTGDQQEDNVTKEMTNVNNEDIEPIGKNRKRKSTTDITELAGLEDAAEVVEASGALDEKLETRNKKKKRRVIHTNEEPHAKNTVLSSETSEQMELKIMKTKRSNMTHMAQENLRKSEPEIVEIVKTKKRKTRDNEDTTHRAKVQKQKSSDKIHVPRLPETIISQLSDKPKPHVEKKKYVIATTSFVIEDLGKRPTKPSNYLEESVYLNESPKIKKQKYSFKDVKVLPSLPTATTSYKGFTSDFKVKVLEENTPFIAQALPSNNFKKDLLQKNRMRKLGTLEKYKKFRNEKVWKF